MRPTVVVTDPVKTPLDTVDALAGFGTATVHEAQGRGGLPGERFRPIQSGVRVAGTAVTVSAWPGDNLMIHAAVEQCGVGDVLVVTTNSPSTDGMFGELFATALQSRGVRGLVIDAGVRDLTELNEMGFPVWSTAVSAQGTVKATAGSVNVPVTLGRVSVDAGDVVVADDDGVVIVPRRDASAVVDASRARLEKEDAARAAFRDGELGLDRYGLRPLLVDLGVRYLTQKEFLLEQGRVV